MVNEFPGPLSFVQNEHAMFRGFRLDIAPTGQSTSRTMPREKSCPHYLLMMNGDFRRDFPR